MLVQSGRCGKLSINAIPNQYLANLSDNAKFQNMSISKNSQR